MRIRMTVRIGVALLAATLAVGSLTAAFAQAPGGPGSGPMMGGAWQHGAGQPLRSSPSAQMGPMMGPPLEQLSGDAFDRAFLMQMTMHHAMAVMMARPAESNGPHAELRTAAGGMIQDQTREIAQMRGWLKEWYGVDMPDMVAMMEGMSSGRTPIMPGMSQMPMGGMEDMSMMASLWKLPPNRLEAVFMSMMIPHHQGAIDMANLAPQRAAHQELKDLAEGIISSQSTEIDEMNGWLAAWYGF